MSRGSLFVFMSRSSRRSMRGLVLKQCLLFNATASAFSQRVYLFALEYLKLMEESCCFSQTAVVPEYSFLPCCHCALQSVTTHKPKFDLSIAATNRISTLYNQMVHLSNILHQPLHSIWEQTDTDYSIIINETQKVSLLLHGRGIK